MSRLMAQVFKTAEGARKRAAFENANNGYWVYVPVRCIGDIEDTAEFNAHDFKLYTWRLRRTRRIA